MGSSNLSLRQSRSELTVFRGFAEVCPLPIRKDSIVKQEPLEPDILCHVEGVGEVSFELTEIIDQGVARRLMTQVNLQPRLLELWKQLPASQREHMRGMSVARGFRESAPHRAKERLLPEIIGWLLKTPPGHVGDVEIPGADSGTVEYLKVVERSDLNVSGFHVSSYGSYRDETVAAVEAKLSFGYDGSQPIELLAYYAAQGLHPIEMWRHDMDDLLDRRLAASRFQQVWVFDFASRTVPYVRGRS